LKAELIIDVAMSGNERGFEREENVKTIQID